MTEFKRPVVNAVTAAGAVGEKNVTTWDLRAQIEVIQGRSTAGTYLPAELSGKGVGQFIQVCRDLPLEQFTEPRILVDARYDTSYHAFFHEPNKTLVDFMALEGGQEIIGAP